MTKTRTTAQLLGVSPGALLAAIRSGKVAEPIARDVSGHYLWSEQEIEAARAALAVDRRRRVPEPVA